MKKRVGILRGGNSADYEKSIKQGGEVLSFILENLSDKYQPVDILIDKDDVWHIAGKPVLPADLIQKVDIVYNTSGPAFAQILESFSIPHVSLSPFSKIFENSRELLKEHLVGMDLPMPKYLVIPAFQEDFDGREGSFAIKKAKEVHEKFGAPWIVKTLTPDESAGPVRGREGSQRPSASNGTGIHVAKTFPELVDAILDISRHGKSILVEELIAGKNAFMHTVRGFRGSPARNASHSDAGVDIYVFPAGNFSKEQKINLEEAAKNLHRHLGATHYLKSNFVVHPKRGIFLTSIEFSPDFKKDSHLQKSCESVGAKMEHLLEHILESNLK